MLNNFRKMGGAIPCKWTNFFYTKIKVIQRQKIVLRTKEKIRKTRQEVKSKRVDICLWVNKKLSRIICDTLMNLSIGYSLWLSRHYVSLIRFSHLLNLSAVPINKAMQSRCLNLWRHRKPSSPTKLTLS